MPNTYIYIWYLELAINKISILSGKTWIYTLSLWQYTRDVSMYISCCIMIMYIHIYIYIKCDYVILCTCLWHTHSTGISSVYIYIHIHYMCCHTLVTDSIHFKSVWQARQPRKLLQAGRTFRWRSRKMPIPKISRSRGVAYKNDTDILGAWTPLVRVGELA